MQAEVAEAEADAGPEAVSPRDFQTNDDVGAAPAWVLPLPVCCRFLPCLWPDPPPAPSVAPLQSSPGAGLGCTANAQQAPGEAPDRATPS